MWRRTRRGCWRERRRWMVKESKEFMRNSTIHGLKYIEQSNRHPIERICWVLFVLLGLSVSAYFCWLEWDEWDKSPLLVTLDPTTAVHESLPFPVVTICSTNKISKKRLIEVAKLPRYQNVSYDTLVQVLSYLSQFDHLIEDEDEFLDISNQLSHGVLEFTVDELNHLINETAPRCGDLIIDCIWKSGPISCDHIFVPEITDDGNCCTFEIDANVGDYGIYAGLRLILLTNIEDHVMPATRFDGFKVLLHNPTDYPDIRKRNFVIGPGSETLVAVNRVATYSTTAVAQLPFEKRHCYFPHEAQLQFFPDYSTSACFANCRRVKIVDQCQCRRHFWKGGNDSIRICSLSDYPCVAKVSISIQNSDQCFCPATCNDYWFTTEITSAPFPSTGFSKTKTFQRIHTKIQSMSIEDHSKRLSGLSIFFQYNAGDQYKMDVRFRLVDFIAMVGGILGLGLGFSFISAVELCYFILFRCCFFSGKRLLVERRIWPSPIRRSRSQSLSVCDKSTRDPVIDLC